MIENWPAENSNCNFAVGLKKQLFKCHKSVLSKMSPVLDKLLFNNDRQSEEDEELEESIEYQNAIAIPEIGPEAFSMFCEFAYNGKIINVENYKKHTGSNEKSLCYCDACRKSAHNFFGKFHQLCFLAKKYEINDSFKDYLLDFVNNGNVRPVIYHQFYLYYAYDGACSIGAEELMNSCQERIQNGKICYITQPIVNYMYVENFVKLIYLLFETFMNSTSCNVFNHNRRLFCYYLFKSLDTYAITNGLMKGRPYQILPPNNTEITQTPNAIELIQELFQNLIYDERMTAEAFAVGPSRSMLLTEDDDIKLCEKFSKTH